MTNDKDFTGKCKAAGCDISVKETDVEWGFCSERCYRATNSCRHENCKNVGILKKCGQCGENRMFCDTHSFCSIYCSRSWRAENRPPWNEESEYGRDGSWALD